ncbi:DUF4123 domain-containing protein [Xenorhabdus bovienii]|uniref:DUF4123 domain-containing protein n=2 Tax=Xenorhabdus bovienii TaxID=40576 RepID=A0A077QES9_XENBV|nr:DUF4123 domain-containing protein [Xenorhabdus bovienii]MDE9446961.1 DUF4123 domain-containing protein [Xenorhabdus bovienii]MDE9452972.1 DUF4123 domain-containing protein [Xenorhabdus bovienii]MDE9481333.1 DUF4123 domain-containing protein [Xenorhabdus bovienii]MDE9550681.1 DUF4123 domain-containing protein [Xenorhabdus bovienii]MDE9554038.1 DUF4123 domain-containing protein [Xenorhabdus bovienii]
MYRQEDYYQHYHQKYEHIWVTDFSYSYHISGSQQSQRYSAQALIQANSQHHAIEQLSDYMLNTLQADEGQYEKILPFLHYLDSTERLEKDLIQNSDNLSEVQSIIILNALDISESLPIDTGELAIIPYPCTPFTGENDFNRHWISEDTYALLYQQSQNNKKYAHCYLVIDAGVYHKHAGHFIVPSLMVSGLPYRCLFKGETQIALEDAAPYLIELTGHEDIGFLRDIFITHYTPDIGIFIHSDSTFDELYNHLRKYPYLKQERSQNWVFFRFYYPSTLDLTLKGLSRGALASFMRHIGALYAFGHENNMMKAAVAESIRATKLETVTINDRMNRNYERYMEQKFFHKVAVFIKENIQQQCQVPEEQLPAFIIKHANYAYLHGFTLELTGLYYIMAKSVTVKNEALWNHSLNTVLSEPSNQEARAYKLLKECFTPTTRSQP